MAQRVLTPEDWRLVDFYRRVSHQFTDEGPRLEGLFSAVRFYGYPRSEAEWLVDGAVMLYRLIHEIDKVHWKMELGKPMRDVTPEDVHG